MKLNWNFQRGGVSEKKPFHGGGMGIFWNYTMYITGDTKVPFYLNMLPFQNRKPRLSIDTVIN